MLRAELDYCKKKKKLIASNLQLLVFCNKGIYFFICAQNLNMSPVPVELHTAEIHHLLSFLFVEALALLAKAHQSALDCVSS